MPSERERMRTPQRARPSGVQGSARRAGAQAIPAGSSAAGLAAPQLSKGKSCGAAVTPAARTNAAAARAESNSFLGEELLRPVCATANDGIYQKSEGFVAEAGEFAKFSP